MQKLYILSLGCAKNLIDSEVMGSQAVSGGLELTENPDLAQAILINTCAFIQPAKEEALEAILAFAEKKKQVGGNLKLIAAGCLVQRYGKELFDELPEVDLFIGTGEVGRFGKHLLSLNKEKPRRQIVLSKPDFLMTAANERILPLQAASAYLKISDGCSNCCSYCAIPSMRGVARSRQPDDILLEAQNLSARGIREIILIGQDTTAYGLDLKKRPTLSGLLSDLASLSGVRLRLLYAHPAHVTDDLLETIAASDNICRYLDLPAQHIDDAVLSAMNRKVSSRTINQIIVRARGMMPDIALRTSLIVGFPGETAKRFARLLDFVKEARFDHLGVFTYSREEGTTAALLSSRISEKEKARRRDLLMSEQADISYNINQTLIGSVQEVLIEEKSERQGYALVGRCRRQAPEIDGVTYVQGADAKIGQIVSCRLTASDHYDLFGEIIKDRNCGGRRGSTTRPPKKPKRDADF